MRCIQKGWRCLALGAIAISASACASQPDKIGAASVSALTYKDYNCDQVALELDRIERRTNELHSNLKSKADADAAQMAVGMILFWPALFLLEGGDGPEAQEYARLKGERDALQQIAVQHQCALSPTQTQPTDQTPATDPVKS